MPYWGTTETQNRISTDSQGHEVQDPETPLPGIAGRSGDSLALTTAPSVRGPRGTVNTERALPTARGGSCARSCPVECL